LRYFINVNNAAALVYHARKVEKQFFGKRKKCKIHSYYRYNRKNSREIKEKTRTWQAPKYMDRVNLKNCIVTNLRKKKTVYYVVAYLPELCLDTSLCRLTLNNLNPPLNVQEKMLRESRK